MVSNKSKIQSLLITYLQKFGSIDLRLPDGVALQIGITQESKHGEVKNDDYCWVLTSRDDRSTMLDRYSMRMLFENPRRMIDSHEQGTVYVL